MHIVISSLYSTHISGVYSKQVIKANFSLGALVFIFHTAAIVFYMNGVYFKCVIVDNKFKSAFSTFLYFGAISARMANV